MLIHAISTGSMSPESFHKTAKAAAPWLDAIHLREPAWSERETLDTAAKWTMDTTLLINLKTPGAVRTTSGLHLPESAPHHSRMTGRSVHSPEAAIRAEAEGAAYVLAGPFRHPLSKQATTILGRQGLEGICRAVRIPVIAVGGIVPGVLCEAKTAGASGIAVITAIFGSQYPEQAAYELREEALTCRN